MALTELLGKPLRTQEQLVIIEVYGGRISRIIDNTTPLDVLKDGDEVIIYEVPTLQQARLRRLSFPLDKTSLTAASAELPNFAIHRYHEAQDTDADKTGSHIVGKPFPLPPNLTWAQLYNFVWNRFKTTLGYAQELAYADLIQQINESTLKQQAGDEKGSKKSQDAAVHSPTAGPFIIRVVDKFFNCGSCDKGFRCDGCDISLNETSVSVPSDSYIVVDWMIPKDEFESKLMKSVLFNLSADQLEDGASQMTPKLTIHDCLHKFISHSNIPGWFCQNCKDFKKATKVTTIGELPSSLMIHFSRFVLQSYWPRVSKAEVDFPISGLDLTSYVEFVEPSQKVLYDLNAVLMLSGNRGYSACVRNYGDNRFYYYAANATYLLPSEESDLPSLKSILCSGDACVLFYEKRKN